MTQARVAIVGGGLAGLQAARLLQAAGVDWRLIEARDRLGGRILSVDDQGRPGEDGFDLGPSWYWPAMQPAIGALVAALDLDAFRQNIVGDVIFERMAHEPPQRYGAMAQEPPSMRLVGGTAALVRALARDLPPERIRLGARVTAMALTGAGVQLTVEPAEGAVETPVFSQVVAALPPRLLDAAIAFIPEQDAAITRRWRATPTWMAPHAKFFALYDRPFWREAGLSGAAQSMVGPMVEIHDATTASGEAALFGFLGIGADQRAMLGEAALTGACLAQLARLFGEGARSPRASLLKDWAADPLTATGADRAAGGHVVPGGGAWVSGSWEQRLFLAGSETSPVEPGYLAGAVVAAGRAVDAVLAGQPIRG